MYVRVCTYIVNRDIGHNRENLAPAPPTVTPGTLGIYQFTLFLLLMANPLELGPGQSTILSH